LRLPLDVCFFSESDLLTERQRNDVMGHFRIHASQQIALLFDHLVGV
jgi:hypothetical protein